MSYRPRWAPHVVMVIVEESVDPESGKLEEQKLSLLCEKCGTRAQAVCTSGQPRRHVSAFARAHAHQEER